MDFHLDIEVDGQIQLAVEEHNLISEWLNYLIQYDRQLLARVIEQLHIHLDQQTPLQHQQGCYHYQLVDGEFLLIDQGTRFESLGEINNRQNNSHNNSHEVDDNDFANDEFDSSDASDSFDAIGRSAFDDPTKIDSKEAEDEYSASDSNSDDDWHTPNPSLAKAKNKHNHAEDGCGCEDLLGLLESLHDELR